MAKDRKGTKDLRKQQATNHDLNFQALQRALAWIVNENIFSPMTLHGNTTWTTGQLVVLAVLWVWSDRGTLTGAFAHAKQLALSMLGKVALTSYQGLSNALVTWTPTLLPLIQRRLHALMEQIGGDYWRIGGWLPLAVDGSRITTPRTKGNEADFSAPHFGQSASARGRRRWKNKKRRSKRLGERVKPQIWLTLMWHMGLCMPWSWKTGPSTSSERRHFLEMLATLVFPEKTLFCADAGFVGYELWKALVDAGHHFLIRVGGNVRLLQGLGRTRQSDGLVYLWPADMAQKKQVPLVLRLIVLQGPRGMVYLVTNVLARKALSDQQAAQLYRMRWGVELQFRSYKQTFGRGKLLSRTPQRALTELDWSLLGLWMIQLLAVKEQLAIASPPQCSSVALAVAVIQETMHARPGEVCNPRMLRLRLSAAVKDEYHRTTSKRARYRPHIKDVPSAGKPIIITATTQQRKAYQRLTIAA
jgi:Transposase DDE domain